MNKINKFLMKNKNRNKVLIILMMGVAFATVATSLYINGETTISSNMEDFDVKFTKVIRVEEDISSSTISVDGKV